MEDHDVSALMVSRSLQSVEVAPRKVEAGWEAAAFADALCALQTDCHSESAGRLLKRLDRFIRGRVHWVGRSRYRDLLSEAALEDVISDVLFQIMSGALLQFRGHTLSELLGFSRTIADRNVWRAARRRIRERETLIAMEQDIHGWTARSPRPDHTLIAIPQTPLCEADAGYLLSLIEAGSHANLARSLGVSRAAVTQRIQRIRGRIARLPPTEQETAESWLRHSAARKHARAVRTG